MKNGSILNTPEHLSPAMRGAFSKGYAACLDGKQITDCPYNDTRKLTGQVTWSRAFRRAWTDGWKSAHDGITQPS